MWTANVWITSYTNVYTTRNRVFQDFQKIGALWWFWRRNSFGTYMYTVYHINVETAEGICGGQGILEGTGKMYATTSSSDDWCRHTCGGWQLGSLHCEQLGDMVTLSCKGAEDAVITTSSGAAHTHITPRQRECNGHNTLRRLCHTRHTLVVVVWCVCV